MRRSIPFPLLVGILSAIALILSLHGCAHVASTRDSRCARLDFSWWKASETYGGTWVSFGGGVHFGGGITQVLVDDTRYVDRKVKQITVPAGMRRLCISAQYTRLGEMVPNPRGNDRYRVTYWKSELCDTLSLVAGERYNMRVVIEQDSTGQKGATLCVEGGRLKYAKRFPKPM